MYLIHPYIVGKDKKSLAMVIPSELVKALEINPQAIYLSLKVIGVDNIHLQIIGQSDLERKDIENNLPLVKVLQTHPNHYKQRYHQQFVLKKRRSRKWIDAIQ
jgi:hypothetical protein